VRPWR